jgi:O-antigen ligase
MTTLPLLIPIALFLLWGILTLVYSQNPYATIYESIRLASIFFIFLLSYTIIHSKKQFNNLLLIILASLIIPILVGAYQFVFGIGYVDNAFAVNRMYATFAHPNIFAFYLVVASASALLLTFHHPHKKVQWLAWVSFFIIIATLVATYARAAWLTFFAFFGLYAVIKKPRILPVLIILPIILFFLVPTIQDRVLESFSFSPSSSLVWRLTIWDDTIRYTLQENRMLQGYGLNTFESVAENLRGINFAVNQPHSEFVRAFVEGGIIGVLVLALYFIAPLKSFATHALSASNKHQKEIFLILTCLWIALMLLSITDHVIRSTSVQWILWAMIGGAFGAFKDDIQRK